MPRRRFTQKDIDAAFAGWPTICEAIDAENRKTTMMQKWFLDVVKHAGHVELKSIIDDGGDKDVEFLTVYTRLAKFYMCHRHGRQIGYYCPRCSVQFPLGIAGAIKNT